MSSFPETLDVSRETMERLSAYAKLLTTWTRRINLIAPTTIDTVMARHVWDSAQFWLARRNPVDRWCDLGTGGGLPGMIVAILAREEAPEVNVTLIEADQRKAAFLRNAAAQLSLKNVAIVAERIEAAVPVGADILSARALAPLPRLLPFVHRHLAETGCAILAKGANVAPEIEAARKDWCFEVEMIPSRTNENGCLLRLEKIERV